MGRGLSRHMETHHLCLPACPGTRTWPRWGCFGSMELRTVRAREEKCLSNDRGDLNSSGSQTSLSSRHLQSSEL